MLPQNKCITPHCLPCNKLGYEQEEFRIVQDYLNKLADKGLLNGGFIDVGAHVGLWSMRLMEVSAMRASYPRSFAIEPDTHNFQQLNQNLLPYPNVARLNIAAWHKATDRLRLMSNKEYHAGGYYVQDNDLQTDLLIAGIRLDTTVGDCPINFIKIDTEGAELRVLQGAIDILSANENMLLCIEIFNPHLARFGWGMSSLTIEIFLSQLGFHPLAERDLNILSNTRTQKSVANVFFVKGFR